MKADVTQKPGLTWLLAVILVASLVSILAYATSNQSKASDAAVQSSSVGAVSASLPTPVGTVTYAMPTLAPPPSLINASPAEIGHTAIAATYASKRVVSGKPQAVLVRPVTLEQLGEMGLGWTHFSTAEEPPLMLVILKGDFSSSANLFAPYVEVTPCPLGLGGIKNCPEPEHYHYVGYVYDLWASVPSIFMQSKDGSIFRQALNDLSLPNDESPLNPPGYKPASSGGLSVLHYGDTGIGEPSEGKVVHQGYTGAAHYIAYSGINHHNDMDNQPADPNHLYATVAWNWNAPTGGQDYIAANNRLLPQVAAQGGQVEVSVVFKDYMPVTDFSTFVQKYSVKPSLSYVRATDENPKPVYAPYYTLKLNANNADAIPQAALDSQLSTLKSDPQKQVNLKGVYVTHAWVDAKQLTALAADATVYYVDINANLVRSDLAKANIADSAQTQVITYPQLIFNSLVEQPYQKR